MSRRFDPDKSFRNEAYRNEMKKKVRRIVIGVGVNVENAKMIAPRLGVSRDFARELLQSLEFDGHIFLADKYLGAWCAKCHRSAWDKLQQESPNAHYVRLLKRKASPKYQAQMRLRDERAAEKKAKREQKAAETEAGRAAAERRKIESAEARKAAALAAAKAAEELKRRKKVETELANRRWVREIVKRVVPADKCAPIQRVVPFSVFTFAECGAA